MQDPRACQSMAQLRALIDRIDRDLVKLMARRQACIDRAVVLKQSEGLPARIPARVAEVLARVTDEARDEGLDPVLAERLWRLMVEWSIAREEAQMGGQRGDDRT